MQHAFEVITEYSCTISKLSFLTYTSRYGVYIPNQNVKNNLKLNITFSIEYNLPKTYFSFKFIL